MAFHTHLSHDMALSHFAEQHLAGNPSALRPILTDQLDRPSSSSSSVPADTGKDAAGDFHRLVMQTNAGKPGGGPTWLMNSAVLRPQQSQQQFVDGSFLHLQTTSEASTSPVAGGAAAAQWFARPSILRHSPAENDVSVSSDSVVAAAMSHGSADLNSSSKANNNAPNNGGGGTGGGGQNPGGGGEIGESEVGVKRSGGGGVEGEGTWQSARYKAEILSHTLYEQLLSAHVACLRIATPVDQLPRIDAQLAQSQHVVAKYSVLGGHGNQLLDGDDKELDQFMVSVCVCVSYTSLIPATVTKLPKTCFPFSFLVTLCARVLTLCAFCALSLSLSTRTHTLPPPKPPPPRVCFTFGIFSASSCISLRCRLEHAFPLGSKILFSLLLRVGF